MTFPIIFFWGVRICKFYCLSKFQLYDTVLLATVTMFFYVFYFGLQWVFIAVHGLSLIAVSRDLLILAEHGLLIALASLAEHGL